MPRKTRITAVPVDQPQEEGLAKAWGYEEGKTGAEHMTYIINEVSLPEGSQSKGKVEQQEPENVEALFAEAAHEEPVVAKAKAKRACRAKPKEEPKDEPNQEEPNQEEPTEGPKEVPKRR